MSHNARKTTVHDLACFGGNGNGYRIVYSPSTIQDLYDYGIKVFNIAWNRYGLVVWINHAYRVVYIRFLGTHEEHDAIDAQSI